MNVKKIFIINHYSYMCIGWCISVEHLISHHTLIDATEDDIQNLVFHLTLNG